MKIAHTTNTNPDATPTASSFCSTVFAVDGCASGFLVVVFITDEVDDGWVLFPVTVLESEFDSEEDADIRTVVKLSDVTDVCVWFLDTVLPETAEAVYVVDDNELVLIPVSVVSRDVVLTKSVVVDSVVVELSLEESVASNADVVEEAELWSSVVVEEIVDEVELEASVVKVPSIEIIVISDDVLPDVVGKFVIEEVVPGSAVEELLHFIVPDIRIITQKTSLTLVYSMIIV